MQTALSIAMDALAYGMALFIICIGLSLTMGLMRVVNFAHGELYMLGGVMGWWATTRLGLDFFTGLLLVAVVMAAFGWLVDRLLIERIRDQGEEPGILLTIGHIIAGSVWAIFHILIITLQAFVFMMLTLVYVGQAHDTH